MRLCDSVRLLNTLFVSFFKKDCFFWGNVSFQNGYNHMITSLPKLYVRQQVNFAKFVTFPNRSGVPEICMTNRD
jgi:hypothetical protein